MYCFPILYIIEIEGVATEKKRTTEEINAVTINCSSINFLHNWICILPNAISCPEIMDKHHHNYAAIVRIHLKITQCCIH